LGGAAGFSLPQFLPILVAPGGAAIEAHGAGEGGGGDSAPGSSRGDSKEERCARLVVLRLRLELYPVVSPLVSTAGWRRRVGEALLGAPSAGAFGRRSGGSGWR
jgi:hypothetical protein